MKFREFYNFSEKTLRVGVVGYSDKKFNKEKASDFLKKAFDEIVEGDESTDIALVSGWTNLGIPAIAYKEGKARSWKTVGIACKKAKEFELFPCEEGKLIGEEWGDESEAFLNDINILVRVGGGKQSKAETAKAKEMGLKVIEFDLEEEK